VVSEAREVLLGEMGPLRLIVRQSREKVSINSEEALREVIYAGQPRNGRDVYSTFSPLPSNVFHMLGSINAVR